MEKCTLLQTALILLADSGVRQHGTDHFFFGRREETEETGARQSMKDRRQLNLVQRSTLDSLCATRTTPFAGFLANFFIVRQNVLTRMQGRAAKGMAQTKDTENSDQIQRFCPVQKYQ